MKKVIRFTASWCGPCKMLAKTLENVKTDVPIEVIDIDDNPSVAMEYGIRSVPTLIMTEDGSVLKRQVGALPQGQLQEWLND